VKLDTGHNEVITIQATCLVAVDDDMEKHLAGDSAFDSPTAGV
jgi:hypothetical protein